MSARSPSRFRGAPRARVIGVEAVVAESPLLRLLGLALLCREAAPDALLLPRCRSIHTLGMRFRIDVVFLDGEGRVISRADRLGPARIAREPCAAAVLEVPSRDHRLGAPARGFLR